MNMFLLALLLPTDVSAQLAGDQTEIRFETKSMSSGCIREDHIDYYGHDIGGRVALANPQACAEHCVSVEGGLFWTYSHKSKNCFVKSSDSGRRYEGTWEDEGHVVSGTRACGLSDRTTSTQLSPAEAVVSQQRDDFAPDQCSDSSNTTICVVPEAPAPWLALDLGSRAHVDKVEMSSRGDCCGERLSNFEVRVTDSLPPSGDLLMFF